MKNQQLIFRILFYIILYFNGKLCSQNIYGGEIIIESSSSLTYTATIALSIDNSVNTSNRPYLLLDWGDLSPLDTFKTVNITCGNIAYTKNYTSTHTYSSINNYTLSCYIGNYVSAIFNIPSSNNKSLTLEYYLNLNSNINSNNSPISNTCLTNTFATTQYTFNQNSYDSDNDSLSYKLYNPLFLPGFNNTGFSINNISGLISNSNSNNGHYLIPVKTEEWRRILGINYLVGISFRYHSLICSTINSINEFNFNLFKIFPNPTNSILNIEQNQLQSATISIANPLGEIVLTQNFVSQIDLSNLASGMYYITVQNGNDKRTMKVVKQ